MKRGLTILVFLSLILILSLTFVSAGFFNDIWDKITGRVVSTNPSCGNTCSSLGYNCGLQTVCGLSTNCGSCSTGLTCTNGKCVSILKENGAICSSDTECKSGNCDYDIFTVNYLANNINTGSYAKYCHATSSKCLFYAGTLEENDVGCTRCASWLNNGVWDEFIGTCVRDSAGNFNWNYVDCYGSTSYCDSLTSAGSCTVKCVQCRTDSQCPNPILPKCVNNVCVRQNSTNSNCSATQCNDNNPCTVDYCSPTLGCVYKIATGVACTSDGNVCTTDVCSANGACVHNPIAGCCTSDSQCSVGQVCSNNVCVSSTPVCGDNKVNQATEKCDGADLNGATCTSILGSGYTGTLRCSSRCIFDTSLCVLSTSTCGDGICNNGETCANCPVDCGPCVEQCSSSVPCPSGQSCVNGVCVAIGKPCLVDATKCNLDWKVPVCGTTVPSGDGLQELCEIPGNRSGSISAGFSFNNGSCANVSLCTNGCSNGACVKPCSDSDGGINFTIKGEVTTNVGGGVQISIDYCDNSATLNESYCEGNIAKTITHDCGMENKVCVNGACIQPCVDNDSGLNYYTYGTISGQNGAKLISSADYCWRDGKGLMEGYCTSEGYPTFSSFACPKGCANGACKRGAISNFFNNLFT
jgi:hypothetical protein